MASPSKFAGFYNAGDFAYGINKSVAPLQVIAGPNATGSGTLTLAFATCTTNDGVSFSPLNTNAPINVGGNSSNETVTPSAVSATTPLVYGSSTLTATFTFLHGTGDQIRSGTVGLQEAINLASASGGGIVIVDAGWVTLGGTSAMISAAVLPASGKVSIQDNRGGAGAAITQTTVLTAAQITTLNSVGVPNLLPAPGAGNVIEVDRLWIEEVPNTTAFTGGGNITLAYGTQAAQTAATAVIAATLFTTSGTVAEISSALPVTPGTNGVIASATLLNKAVGLYAATADFAAGNTTAIVKVSYRILTGF
jgi:hypothetical protein